MTTFNPAAWVRRLESLGGYVLLHDGKWMWGVPRSITLRTCVPSPRRLTRPRTLWLSGSM